MGGFVDGIGGGDAENIAYLWPIHGKEGWQVKAYFPTVLFRNTLVNLLFSFLVFRIDFWAELNKTWIVAMPRPYPRSGNGAARPW